MSDDVCNLTCVECGIEFSFSKKVEDQWRRTHKLFYCPNGHGQQWTGETPDQKELKELRIKVKGLEDKLVTIALRATESNKRVEELTAELELWRPSTKE